MKTQELESSLGTAVEPIGIATLNPASITGLDACIEDARLAALDNDRGPAEPHNYSPLLGRLEAVRTKLPPLYRDTMVAPFIRTLHQLGEQGFNRILLR